MVKHNDQWGTVCDDGLSPDDSDQARATRGAQSACYTLGFSGGSIETYSSSLSEPILMDDVNCASSTTIFLECSHVGGDKDNCSHSEDVLLTCT